MKKLLSILTIPLGLVGPYFAIQFAFAGMNLMGEVIKAERTIPVLTFICYLSAVIFIHIFIVKKQTNVREKILAAVLSISLFILSVCLGKYLLPTYKAWV